MINLTHEELNELRELYKKEIGGEISDEDLIKHAEQLLNLLTIVYKPDDEV